MKVFSSDPDWRVSTDNRKKITITGALSVKGLTSPQKPLGTSKPRRTPVETTYILHTKRCPPFSQQIFHAVRKARTIRVYREVNLRNPRHRAGEHKRCRLKRRILAGHRRQVRRRWQKGGLKRSCGSYAYHRVFAGLVHYAMTTFEMRRPASKPVSQTAATMVDRKRRGGGGKGQRWIILPQPRLTEPLWCIVAGEKRRRDLSSTLAFHGIAFDAYSLAHLIPFHDTNYSRGSQIDNGRKIVSC